MINKSEGQVQAYAAGALFDVGQLASNMYIRRALENISNDSVRVLLPQELEFPNFRSETIKHWDLLGVFSSDCGIINMDGIEADSGALIEFMVMKTLGLPTVLYRTDFRKAGDQDREGAEPWNLMISGWPDSRSVVFNGMELYKSIATRTSEPDRIVELMYAKCPRYIGVLPAG